MSIRILLVDDHQMLREGFRSLISEQSNLTVIAEAEDGRSAVQLAAKLSPDVVVMDISMPGMNGIEAARQILIANPVVKILALSMHLDRRMVLEMFKAGASGYLHKECAFDEVVRAVQVVASNVVYLSPKIADILFKDYGHRVQKGELSPVSGMPERERAVLQLMEEGKDMREIASLLHTSIKNAESCRVQMILDHILPHLLSAQNDTVAGLDVSLTPRECEIMIWVKDGKSTSEIASILNISQDTVKFHMKNVFQKLGATSRSQAIAIAIENKLVES
ncbi:MAG: response regulator transcription factor [Nitrospirota bacterium]